MTDLAYLRKRAAQQAQTGNYWAGKVVALCDELDKAYQTVGHQAIEAVTDRRLRDARQALWDVYGILGFDQDGDKTPDALVHPPLEDVVRDAAREFREQADEALDDIPAPGAIVLTPGKLDGGWVAECRLIPGCISQGDSAAEALENVLDAALTIVSVAIDHGERSSLEAVIAELGFTKLFPDTVEDE